MMLFIFFRGQNYYFSFIYRSISPLKKQKAGEDTSFYQTLHSAKRLLSVLVCTESRQANITFAGGTEADTRGADDVRGA